MSQSTQQRTPVTCRTVTPQTSPGTTAVALTYHPCSPPIALSLEPYPGERLTSLFCSSHTVTQLCYGMLKILWTWWISASSYRHPCTTTKSAEITTTTTQLWSNSFSPGVSGSPFLGILQLCALAVCLFWVWTKGGGHVVTSQ